MNLDHAGSVKHMIDDHHANPDRLAEMLALAPQHDEFLHECLHYREAVELVTADVRESYPDMSYIEAVEHVRSTLAVEDIYDEGSDVLAAAYRIVIEGA